MVIYGIDSIEYLRQGQNIRGSYAVFNVVVKTGMRVDNFVDVCINVPLTEDGFLNVGNNRLSYSIEKVVPRYTEYLSGYVSGEDLFSDSFREFVGKFDFYESDLRLLLINYNEQKGVVYGPEIQIPRNTVNTREYDEKQRNSGSEKWGAFIVFKNYVLIRPKLDSLGRILSCDFVYSSDSLVDSSLFYDVLKEYNNTITDGFEFPNGSYSEKESEFEKYLDACYLNPFYYQTKNGNIYVNLVQIWNDGKIERFGFKSVKEASDNVKSDLVGGRGYSFRYDYLLDSKGRILEDFTKPSIKGLEDFIYLGL